MAERKATNKYYPPEWSPSKGSLNSFRGQHPLRKRARKLSEGILVIRFEMPFNVWCLGCKRHIAKGVRFNAEKMRTGAYFSTPIYQFSFKCPSCAHRIVVRTDPQHTEYVVTEGARRQYRADHGHRLLETSEQERVDPLKVLESKTEDWKKASAQHGSIFHLIQAQERMKDDLEASASLRKKAREERRASKARREHATALGLDLELLPLAASDYQAAASVRFSRPSSTRVQLMSEDIGLQKKSSSLVSSLAEAYACSD